MIRFRTNFVYLFIALCPLVAVWTAVGQSNVSFTLELSAKNQEFHVGETVSITILQTNISDHQVDCSYFGSSAVNHAYDYDVRDEQGNPVEKLQWTKPVPPLSRHLACAIEPGEKDENWIYLSNGYNFTRPGRYTVRVSRPDPETKDSDGNPVKVYSNTITVIIVAADPSSDTAK